MGTCGSCYGRGNVTCPSCGGRRYKTRLTMNFETDMSPCAVCGGTGHVRCSFCGGRGHVETEEAIRSPRIRKKGSASDDPLEGCWFDQEGNYLEFKRDGKQYSVTEMGALGKVGGGRASLAGQMVTLESQNFLLGRYTLQLQLVDDELRGQFKMLGMALPYILHRE